MGQHMFHKEYNIDNEYNKEQILLCISALEKSELI